PRRSLPPTATLFPYTTLFRSSREQRVGGGNELEHAVQPGEFEHRAHRVADRDQGEAAAARACGLEAFHQRRDPGRIDVAHRRQLDRKSTRLNSSHVKISYAVF